MRFQRLLPSLAALAALGACTTGTSALVQSAREILPRRAQAQTVKLDPRFEYLRVTRGKQVGLLWRGSVEQSESGPVDVYFSSAGEVVRLQNGRIVGALGLSSEWRRVEIQAPAWTAAIGQAGARVVRTLDMMPGYVSDLREELALRRIAPPATSALRNIEPSSLTWFEERVVNPGARPLPPARYAVDLARDGGAVVYAEQCLAPDLCLTWQRWSAAVQQSAVP